MKGRIVIRISVRNMTRAAVFAALICLCSWISIPVGDIAFTLQTFAVFLALGLLGSKWGTVAIILYLLLGAVGLPVFSGFRGGLGILAGVTGGYLWGFLLSCALFRLFSRFGILPAMIAGQLICYVCGSLWFSLFSGGGLGLVLLRCVVPFLIPDAVKLYLAWRLTFRLRKFITTPSGT